MKCSKNGWIFQLSNNTGCKYNLGRMHPHHTDFVICSSFLLEISIATINPKCFPPTISPMEAGFPMHKLSFNSDPTVFPNVPSWASMVWGSSPIKVKMAVPNMRSKLYSFWHLCRRSGSFNCANTPTAWTFLNLLWGCCWKGPHGLSGKETHENKRNIIMHQFESNVSQPQRLEGRRTSTSGNWSPPVSKPLMLRNTALEQPITWINQQTNKQWTLPIYLLALHTISTFPTTALWITARSKNLYSQQVQDVGLVVQFVSVFIFLFSRWLFAMWNLHEQQHFLYGSQAELH